MPEDANEVKKNTVTQEQITKLLCAADTDHIVFWNKELIRSFKLPCGFTIIGRAACVDPLNFNLDMGMDIAYKDAEKQLWQLEGYLLQNKLYLSGEL